MDLSLAMLELAVNSLDAGATLVAIRLKAGRTSRLEVRDNGSGMDKATLAKALDPGFSGKGGNGLGLYRLAQAAGQSGGSLKIRSKEGKGTKVTLTVKGAKAGDIAASLAAIADDGSDFDLKARIGGKRLRLRTARVRRELGGMSICDPRAIVAIKKYVNENLR